MKTRTFLHSLPVLFLLTAGIPALGQTTAFTYHGRLNLNGAPVNGPYDMRFVIHGANVGDQPVADPLPVDAVDVVNGLFTVRIDFGDGVFTGPPRWLEVSGLDGSGPKWWVKGWGFTAVTTPVAGDDILLAGGSDPTEPRDPLLNWDKLLAEYDANRDGRLAVDEVPPSLVWHIRKEIPKEVPGNSFPLRFMLGSFMDANRDKLVTKEEWEASEAFSKDKLNADRFVAVRPGGSGDCTDTHVLWKTTKGLSERPSALLYRGRLHFIRDGGLWTVIEPKSGERLLDRERLGIGGQAVASHLAVLRAGDKLDVVAINKLGERVRATPAIAAGGLYVRSAQHLWAFETESRSRPEGRSAAVSD